MRVTELCGLATSRVGVKAGRVTRPLGFPLMTILDAQMLDLT